MLMPKKKKAKPKKQERGKKKSGKKDVGGRPLFDGKNNETVLQKLCYVWALDGSDSEAAFYAGISPAALSDYLKKNPKVSERKAALKNRPVLKARHAVVSRLGESFDNGLKYLERKRKDEFSPKIEIENTDPITPEELDELEKKNEKEHQAMLKKARKENKA